MLQKLKNLLHLTEALIANIRSGYPAKRLYVIGVTGTDGKTTTTSLIYHILKAAGKEVAMITTVGAYIADQSYSTGFHVTTPSSFALQAYIKKAVDKGCKYLVLETTSHALDQYRVWGIDYKIGVLTNITHEHLDYHKTYENYLTTKLKLLQKAPINIINQDDQSYRYILNRSKNKIIITYSLSNPSAHFTPKKFPFSTKMMGDFNELNALAAIAVAKQLNIPDITIREALKSFTPPAGRQEVVYEKDYTVVVDFAHTPNSLEQILSEAKKSTQARLIHLFGSAGERDRSKRPLMGKASSSYADIIILTAEDPRSESVEDINQQIHSGFIKDFSFKDSKHYQVLGKDKSIYFSIPNRNEAIKFAVQIAQKGDLLLLTGKGHEKSLNYGKGEESWDEKQAVVEAIKQAS